MMPYNLKPLQIHLLILTNTSLTLGYSNLIINSVNAVKIRQKETSPKSISNDDSIFPNIKLSFRIYIFSIPKNVNK